jgi:hypothetical protein
VKRSTGTARHHRCGALVLDLLVRDRLKLDGLGVDGSTTQQASRDERGQELAMRYAVQPDVGPGGHVPASLAAALVASPRSTDIAIDRTRA